LQYRISEHSVHWFSSFLVQVTDGRVYFNRRPSWLRTCSNSSLLYENILLVSKRTNKRPAYLYLCNFSADVTRQSRTCETELQKSLNKYRYIISYHIISYISYIKYIISYHISYHIISYIISYIKYIISYIISYYIISYHISYHIYHI
jgi:hypothetical protein